MRVRPGVRFQTLVRIAALGLACAGVSAGSAAAQQRGPAPIVFAGQGAAAPAQDVMLAAAEPRLAGGDEDSYGYGGARQTRAAATIDIRRSNYQRTEPRAEEAPPVAAQSAAPEQGSQAWLERERVGPPYEANGRWYVPTPEPGYEQTGTASWYGPTFHGQATASGEIFDQEALTAAHPTLPIPSLVQVTNLENGREVIVRVNDRGPFVGERLIDLSRRSAEVLGFEQAGQARVHVRYLGPAPRHVNPDGSSAPAPNAAPLPSAAPEFAPVTAQTDGPMSLAPSEPAPLAPQTYADYAPAEPAAPRAAAAGEGYFVQIGAFSDLTNAHRVRAAVASAGPVAVDTRQTASGELFRVRVGPLASREEAEAARRTLADLGYLDAILASR